MTQTQTSGTTPDSNLNDLMAAVQGAQRTYDDHAKNLAAAQLGVTEANARLVTAQTEESNAQAALAAAKVALQQALAG